MILLRKNMRSFWALLILSLQMYAAVAIASDVGVGIAAMDDMSNNAEPAAVVRVGWSKNLLSRYYYWGRTFGPVTERHHLVTLAGVQEVPSLSFMNVHFGGQFLAQETVLYENAESKAMSNAPSPIRERSYNMGGLVGLGAHTNFGPVLCELYWDSHIFMVGSSAIIFLASARKQTVGLTVGVGF